MNFKYFLINEEQVHLGHKVGDVLTAVHDLENDIGGMGSRQIAKVSEDIVNQIRKILHSQWSPNQEKYLKELQKVAVALMKAIDEKDDLKEIIGQLSQVLGKVSTKLGVKVNTLDAVPEEGGEDVEQQDMQLTGNGPAPQGDPNQQGAPPMQGQRPVQGQPPMPGQQPIPPMPPMG